MSTGTLQETANWVEYCNGTGDTYYANLRRSHGYEEPFNVKYWCIGNEVTTPPDIGWQHHLDVYVREAWEYCKYMKLVDPSIRLILSGGDEDWNRALLDRLYDMCDYISLHYYSATPDYEEIKRFEKGFLAIYEKQVDEYNKKEVNVSCFFPEYKRTAPIRISLDEWNLWYKNYDKASGFGLQTRYEWKAALWVAAFLNMIIRHSDHIGIANMAQMVNVIAPIVATKEGSYYQTIFYPMRNYRRDCGSYFTHASYECDGLDVCATVGEDGRCVVFAVNTLDTPLTLDFESTVEHISVAYSEDQDQINTMEKDVVKEYGETPMKKSVTVPKYSISTIKLI
jgi:alpha-N-arabinofuranosidase